MEFWDSAHTENEIELFFIANCIHIVHCTYSCTIHAHTETAPTTYSMLNAHTYMHTSISVAPS